MFTEGEMPVIAYAKKVRKWFDEREFPGVVIY